MNIAIRSFILTMMSLSFAYGAFFYSNIKQSPLINSEQNNLIYLANRVSRLREALDRANNTTAKNVKQIESPEENLAILDAEEGFSPIKSEETKPKEVKSLLGTGGSALVSSSSNDLEGDSYDSCKIPNLLPESRSFQSTSFALTVNEIDFSGELKDYYGEFDIEFLDSADIWPSDNKGLLKQEVFHHNSQTRLATLEIENNIRVNFELHFLEDFYQFALPSFPETAFDEVIEAYKLSEKGGFLLVGVDEDLEFINIDSKYDAGLYLDHQFKPTNNSDEYHYLLFSGLEEGFHEIIVSNADNLQLNKSVYIRDKEVTFDFISNIGEKNSRNEVCVSFPYQKGEYSEFILSEEKLETDGELDLDILGSNIMNVFSLASLTGSSDLISLDNKNPVIKFNPFLNSEIIIPSDDEVDYILNQFGIEDDFNGCMMQVNLSQSIADVELEAYDSLGLLKPDYFLMQSDGELTKDFLPQSRRLYIFVENEALISGKISYLDESNDFINQRCVEGSFIVNGF